MNNEVIEFIKKLENEHKEYYFVYYRFYMEPNTIFDKCNDSKNDSYSKLDEFKYFFINHDFIDLLDILKYDSNFISKLDDKAFNSILGILYDSIYYFKNVLNSKQSFNGIIGIILKKKASQAKNADIKYFNYDKAVTVYNEYSIMGNDYYSAITAYKVTKEKTLIRIEQDNYNMFPYLETNLLYTDDGLMNILVINSLVCENRFIDIIEKLLPKIEFSKKSVKNIIDILSYSIRVKGSKDYTANEILEYSLIESYDEDRAKELIIMLNEKYFVRNNVILFKKKY